MHYNRIENTNEEYYNNSSGEITEKIEEGTKENNETSSCNGEGKKEIEEEEDYKPIIDISDYKVVMRPKKPKPTFVPSSDEYIHEDVASCLSGNS